METLRGEPAPHSRRRERPVPHLEPRQAQPRHRPPRAGRPRGVRRLAETTDVLIENYRPGVADQIGLGYEELRAVNPRSDLHRPLGLRLRWPVVGGPGHRPGRSGDVRRDVRHRRTRRRAAADRRSDRRLRRRDEWGPGGHARSPGPRAHRRRPADRDLDAQRADLRADHAAGLVVVRRGGARPPRQPAQRRRSLPGLPDRRRLGGRGRVGRRRRVAALLRSDRATRSRRPSEVRRQREADHQPRGAERAARSDLPVPHDGRLARQLPRRPGPVRAGPYGL